LAAMDRSAPVTSISLGMEGGYDHEAAARMAGLVGQPHRRYVLDNRFLADYERHMRWMVHLTDGHYLCQCIVMPSLPFYREAGIEVLLRGHAGELMHMTKAYNFSLDKAALALRDEAGLESWLYHHLQAYMLDATDGPLLAPPPQASMDEPARPALRD